jgi:hypothetical protein
MLASIVYLRSLIEKGKVLKSRVPLINPGSYMTIIPSGAQLHFWNNTDPKEMGGVNELIRRFDTYAEQGVMNDGVEVYLMPFAIKSGDTLPPLFVNEFKKLKYKSVHFGGPTQNFLNEEKEIEDQLYNFARLVDQLEPDNLILHAQHLKENREHIRGLTSKYLKDHQILVENESWYDEWACLPDSLVSILDDFPSFGVCLDVCHIADCNHLSLKDFTDRPEILSKIKQIHFSLSTREIKYDPYISKGFNNYSPNHALYAISDEKIDPAIKEFIHNYPIVTEGVIPTEDKELKFLKKEFQLIKEA